MKSVADLLATSQRQLIAELRLTQGEAAIEAQVLLRKTLGDVSRAWLIVHEKDHVGADKKALFDSMVKRRLQGEPVAYILGSKEFYGLDFVVNPAVLIPRPETETLVELALERDFSTALDLGCGSGAIAICLARARPDAMITAVDFSPAALEVAKANAARNGVANIRINQGNWFESLADESFDLIVSNPPYIRQGDSHLAALQFEPITALTSGVDGLADIRIIVSLAPKHLNSGGWLLFEHGYDQAEQCRELLAAAGFADVFTAADLSGIDRVSGGRLTRGRIGD